MRSIVGKFMRELGEQLAARSVTIELTDAAAEYLAKKGYDPDNGARPLARVVQEEVQRALSEELLFGVLEKGGHVVVDTKDDALAFRFEKKKQNEANEAGQARETNETGQARDANETGKAGEARDASDASEASEKEEKA